MNLCSRNLQIIPVADCSILQTILYNGIIASLEDVYEKTAIQLASHSDLLLRLSFCAGAGCHHRRGLYLAAFCVYRSPVSPLFFVRLFGHVLGHSGIQHFLGNMTLLLVLGPPLEEKYGSKTLLVGIAFTAVTSGILQCILFPNAALLGASGIVFMLIDAVQPCGNEKPVSIPLTLLLVAALYLAIRCIPFCLSGITLPISCTSWVGPAAPPSALLLPSPGDSRTGFRHISIKSNNRERVVHSLVPTFC